MSSRAQCGAWLRAAAVAPAAVAGAAGSIGKPIVVHSNFNPGSLQREQVSALSIAASHTA